MKPVSRWIVLACAVLMIGVLVFPFWKITLFAPQYPEGLQMVIYPNGVRGSLDQINDLNHYIGMRNIANKDFREFTILPYWMGFLIFFGLLTFMLNKINSVKVWISLIILTGIVGIADFWRWEFDYGHHLNPHAAIKIPGMTYQPPLFGWKQLLNFVAGSFPTWGCFMLVIPGLALLYVIWKESHFQKSIVKDLNRKPHVQAA